MYIVNLMEDTVGDTGILFEHGFSIYADTIRHKVLIDTGASEKTWKNADKLGIDLNKVEAVILSHGHYDHGGGILSFSERNPQAPIYVREGALAAHFSTTGGLHSCGLDPRISELSQIRTFKLSQFGIQRINEDVSVFSAVKGRRLWPNGNRNLLSGFEDCERCYLQDDFMHEQHVVIEAEGRRVLISGCAHSGILNILDRFDDLYGGVPDIVISGFHMVKDVSYEYNDYCIMRQTAEELSTMKTVFYTGHCTGDVAFDIMKGIMGDKLKRICSGDTIVSI